MAYYMEFWHAKELASQWLSGALVLYVVSVGLQATQTEGTPPLFLGTDLLGAPRQRTLERSIQHHIRSAGREDVPWATRLVAVMYSTGRAGWVLRRAAATHFRLLLAAHWPSEPVKGNGRLARGRISVAPGRVSSRLSVELELEVEVVLAIALLSRRGSWGRFGATGSTLFRTHQTVYGHGPYVSRSLVTAGAC
jgi:hypothetical protein